VTLLVLPISLGGLLPAEAAPITATVCLRDSTGVGIAGAEAFVSAGSYVSLGLTDATGCVSTDLTSAVGGRTFRILHRGLVLNKTQNTTTNPLVVFQTTAVNIRLLDSTGGAISGAPIDFNNGTWQSLGATDATGTVRTELLGVSTTFRVFHRGLTVSKSQNTGTNPNVVFQTVAVSLRLLTSTGSAIPGAPIDFNNGTWQSLGNTDATGTITTELLGLNTTFRVTHRGLTVSKSQNTGTNPSVVFQTVGVVVHLLDSTGATAIQGALVEFSNGTWQSLGNTDATGTVTAELLGLNTNFRVTHRGLTVNKSQNTATNANLVFQTVPVTVRLLDSTGTGGIPGASVEYFGGTWQSLGTTNASGTVASELLGLSTTFRISHVGQAQQKTQNTATTPNVVFQTGRVLQGTGPRVLAWFSSAWHPFTNGVELLPGSVTFDFDTGPNQAHVVVAGATVYVPFAPTAPIVTALDQSAYEGQPVLLASVSFIDQEAGQAHRTTIDWGDGSPLATGAIVQGNGLAGTVAASHVFADDGTYTVEVCVSDNGNPDAEGCDTLQVTVANLAPVVAILGPSSGEEGSPVTVSSFVSDADPTSLSWVASIGATTVATGTGPDFTFTPADDGHYEVSLTADDGDGGITTVTSQINVLNLAPQVAIVGVPASGVEGTEVNLSSLASDLDPLQFSWIVSLDSSPVANGTGPDFTFTPADDGLYEVSLIADDGDGGITNAVGQVAIANLDPSATITGAPSSVPEDEIVTLGSIGTDPGSTDALTYSWTVTLGGNTAAVGSGPDFSFTPDGAGHYVVTLVVSDGDGGAATAQAAIEVTAVPLPDPEPEPQPEPQPVPEPSPDPGSELPEPVEPTPNNPEPTADQTTRHPAAVAGSSASIPAGQASPDLIPLESQPGEPDPEPNPELAEPESHPDQVMLLALISEPRADETSHLLPIGLILGLLWLGSTLFILATTRMRRRTE
jgi:hypothetical protein